MYVKNPNPIQFSEEESLHIDEIVEDYKNILSKFAKSTTNRPIGSKKIKTWKVPIQRFGNKEPSDYTIVLKTTTKKDPPYFFSVWKGLHSPSTKTITLWATANRTKKFIGNLWNNPDYKTQRREEINFFLTTLLHEMAHAKDPIGRMGTSGLKKALKGTSETVSGWTLYINDAERKEIRAHLVEWELFVKDIFDQLNDPSLDDSKKMKLEENLYHLLVDGNASDLDEFLGGDKWYQALKIPYYLAQKYKGYKNFSKLEDDALEKYIDFFTKKYKKKYKKKPTNKMIEGWKKQREKNYLDMLDAIYNLFVKYGLTDPYTYNRWRSENQEEDRFRYLRDLRIRTLLRSEKVIIRSLNERFSSLSSS